MTIHNPRLLNAEALADQNYNPEIEPASIQLYNLMLPPGGDSEDDLAEHVAAFMDLPTANPFPTVLVNPVKCDIDDITADLVEFRTVLIPAFRTTLSSGDQTTFDAAWPAMLADIVDSEAGLAEFDEHSSRLTSNLSTLAGIAQGGLAIATVLGGLANPCAGLNNFLGSISGIGKQILAGAKAAINSVKSAISGVTGAINGVISNITAGISALKNKISEIRSRISNEIKAFAGAFLSQLRMGIADFLKNIKIDPCLKAIFGGVASNAAKGILG